MNLDIVMAIDIAAPVERVWSAISTQEGLRAWFNPTIVFEPRVGGWVEFSGVHGEDAFTFGGKVVAIEPPRLLSFEWDWVPSRWPVPTLLTIELTPTDEGTHVVMRHHGWERLPDAMRDRLHRDFSQGWEGATDLEQLKALVERGAVPA